MPVLFLRSSIAECFPIGIQPILNDPSGCSGVSNDSPFSWNSLSDGSLPSGKVTRPTDQESR
jgi:hypothetical protein